MSSLAEENENSIRDTKYEIRYASVAELADAQGLGPCVLRDVEVRLLSLALT